METGPLIGKVMIGVLETGWMDGWMLFDGRQIGIETRSLYHENFLSSGLFFSSFFSNRYLACIRKFWEFGGIVFSFVI